MGDRSYVWLRADGRWEARYVSGKNANGKTSYSSVYGRTREEAESKRSDKLRALMTDSHLAELMMRSNRPTLNPEITSDTTARQRTQMKMQDPLPEDTAKTVAMALKQQNTSDSFGFLLCLYMGLSTAELCALKYADFHDGVLTVERSMLDKKDTAGAIVAQQKRDIPMPDCVKELLARMHFAEPDSYVLTENILPVSKPQSAINLFRRLMRKYNLDIPHPDVLRSTFIRRACESSLNIETISEITGMEQGTLKRRFGGYFKADTNKINQLYTPVASKQKATELNLLILGAGSHGHAVKETAERLGVFKTISFLDDNVIAPNVVGSCKDYKSFAGKYPCAFVAMGNNEIRKQMTKQLKEAGFMLPRLIHPDTSVSSSAKIGEGTIIMAQATVNANATVGEGCILATGSITDYGATLSDYTHLDSAAMVTRDATVESLKTVESGEIVRKNNV